MAVNLYLKADAKVEEGKVPVYLKIVEQKKTSITPLDVNVFPEFWSDLNQRVNEFHPNYTAINEKLETAKSKIASIRKDLVEKGIKITSNLLKNHFLGEDKMNFIAYMNKFIANLRDTGNYGTYVNYRSSIKKFNAFLNRNFLGFDEVNILLLKEYQNFLQFELNNSVNTVYNNMKVIRKIVYAAIEEGFIAISKNPFTHLKLEKEEKAKAYLTHAELLQLENVVLGRNNPLNGIKAMFLLSCFTGLKLSSVKALKWNDIKDGEITFTHFGKRQKMKMINKAQNVLHYYKLRYAQDHEVDDKIFKSYSNVYINKCLKRLASEANINKNFTFNMARNTFAVLSIKKGVRLDVLAKLMGHKNFYSILPYTQAQSSNKDVEQAYGVLNNEFY